MKNMMNDDPVRQHIPLGCKLPTRFDDFLRAKPPFAIEWNDLVGAQGSGAQGSVNSIVVFID